MAALLSCPSCNTCRRASLHPALLCLRVRVWRRLSRIPPGAASVGPGPDGVRRVCYVLQVLENSSAERHGFRAGDVVLHVNAVPLTSRQQFTDFVSGGWTDATFTVARPAALRQQLPQRPVHKVSGGAVRAEYQVGSGFGIDGCPCVRSLSHLSVALCIRHVVTAKQVPSCLLPRAASLLFTIAPLACPPPRLRLIN
jgi:hypothetical protein